MNMKFTQYFLHTRLRPDRALIRDDWIFHVFQNPEREQIQSEWPYSSLGKDCGK